MFYNFIIFPCIKTTSNSITILNVHFGTPFFGNQLKQLDEG